MMAGLDSGCDRDQKLLALRVFNPWSAFLPDLDIDGIGQKRVGGWRSWFHWFRFDADDDRGRLVGKGPG